MRKKIIRIISEIMYLKENQVTGETLLEDVITDSMQIVELISVLSSEFEVSIIPKRMKDVTTVDDLINYINKNKGSRLDKESLKSF